MTIIASAVVAHWASRQDLCDISVDRTPQLITSKALRIADTFWHIAIHRSHGLINFVPE